MRKMNGFGFLFIILFFLSACNRSSGNAPVTGWQPTNPGGGGWFMCVGAGPTGVLIVCSDVSGAYRSLDRGLSWDVIGSDRGLKFTHVNAVGFDPKDEKIIYLGLDGGLYRSADKGETFQNVKQGDYWGAIVISAADPNIGYASGLGHSAYIYTTHDRGVSWTAVQDLSFPKGLRVIRLVAHPTDPKIVYLISGEHRFGAGIPAVFRSVDGAQTWERLAEELGLVYDFALDPDDPQTMFVTVKDRGVYLSTDNGITWVRQAPAWGRIFAKSSEVLRVISDDRVWETNNGGRKWSVKSTINDWTEPGWQPAWHFGGGAGSSIGGDQSDPDAYYWVNQQFVYGSFDGGGTFRGLHTREVPQGSNHWASTGIDNTEVYDIEISEADHSLIYIGLWDMGIWRSQDHGKTWMSLNQDEFGWEGGRGGDVRTILTDFTRPQVVWAGSRRTRFEWKTVRVCHSQ